MKRNITAVPKETIKLTNITDINANRAKTIMNTTSELWGKRIAIIPTDLCDIDYTYQRVTTANVNKIRNEWDKELCDCLVVSYRDGKFYIIDGQHRYYAAVANGVEDLPCIVHSGLTDKDEARLFVKLNNLRKPLKPYDTFRANIACGNRDIPDVARDMDIKDICDKYNIVIVEDNALKKSRRLKAITTIRRMYDTHGTNCLEWTFSAIKGTPWYDCGDAYVDCILQAIKNYYIDNLSDLDKAKAKLINVMNTYSPMAVMSYANEVYAEYGRYSRTTMALRELA